MQRLPSPAAMAASLQPDGTPLLNPSPQPPPTTSPTTGPGAALGAAYSSPMPAATGLPGQGGVAYPATAYPTVSQPYTTPLPGPPLHAMPTAAAVQGSPLPAQYFAGALGGGVSPRSGGVQPGGTPGLYSPPQLPAAMPAVPTNWVVPAAPAGVQTPGYRPFNPAALSSPPQPAGGINWTSPSALAMRLTGPGLPVAGAGFPTTAVRPSAPPSYAGPALRPPSPQQRGAMATGFGAPAVGGVGPGYPMAVAYRQADPRRPSSAAPIAAQQPWMPGPGPPFATGASPPTTVQGAAQAVPIPRAPTTSPAAVAAGGAWRAAGPGLTTAAPLALATGPPPPAPSGAASPVVTSMAVTPQAGRSEEAPAPLPPPPPSSSGSGTAAATVGPNSLLGTAQRRAIMSAPSRSSEVVHLSTRAWNRSAETETGTAGTDGPDLQIVERMPIPEEDMYLLVARFLEAGPCKETAKMLHRELGEHGIRGKRYDFEGNTHPVSVQDMATQRPKVNGTFLPRLCARAIDLGNRYVRGSASGDKSVLSTGPNGVLRHPTNKGQPQAPLAVLCARRRGKKANLANVLRARALTGRSFEPAMRKTNFHYHRVNRAYNVMGHRQPIYCIKFDQSGTRLITGGDDCIIKVWDCKTGSLLSTLRGHQSQASDMCVSTDNRLLATAALEGMIRVWRMDSGAPVAALSGHTLDAEVDCIEFCPTEHNGRWYLVSGCKDGTIRFWPYQNSRRGDVIKFLDGQDFNVRNALGCTCRFSCKCSVVSLNFSPGGNFLVAGLTSGAVHVYQMGGLEVVRIGQQRVHTREIFSVSFNHAGTAFLTGGFDGESYVWSHTNGWNPRQMESTWDGVRSKNPREVTFVSWTCDDRHALASVGNSSADKDYEILVWAVGSGKLLRSLKGHIHMIVTIVPHPRDPRIAISGARDGQIIIWDVERGAMLSKTINRVGFADITVDVLDLAVSADGNQIAVADLWGTWSLLDGLSSTLSRQAVPFEQFFTNDQTEVIWTSDGIALDAITQTLPHLLPQRLCKTDGTEYPESMQDNRTGQQALRFTTTFPAIEEARLMRQEQRDTELKEFREAGQKFLTRTKLAQTQSSRLTSTRRNRSRNSRERTGLAAPRFIRHRTQSGRLTTQRVLPTLPEGFLDDFPDDDDFQITEDSDLSDWEGARVIARKRKEKRSQRMREQRAATRAKAREAAAAEEEASAEASAARRASQSQSRRRKRSAHMGLPWHEYLPGPWLTSVIPAESPYVPQIQDQIMYFRQGHEEYATTVLDQGLHPIKLERLPWKKLELRHAEPCLIEDLRFEVGPPSICILRLKLLGGQHAGEIFSLKYRDVDEILDFLILRSRYDRAEREAFAVGDYCSCLIDETKYFGTITKQADYEAAFPQSPWRAFTIHWDSDGSNDWPDDTVSPWDLIREGEAPARADDSAAAQQPSAATEGGQDPTLAAAAVGDAEQHNGMPGLVETEATPAVAGAAEGGDAAATDMAAPTPTAGVVVVDAANADVEMAPAQGTSEATPGPAEAASSLQADAAAATGVGSTAMSTEPDAAAAGGTPVVEAATAPSEASSIICTLGVSDIWTDTADIKRLDEGLRAVMELPVATEFVSPVDYETYTDYCRNVAYPIDLTMVRQRLVNGYYRRPQALIWDLRQLCQNAEIYNVDESRLVRSAKLLTTTLTQFVQDKDCQDPLLGYPALLQGPDDDGTVRTSGRRRQRRHFDDGIDVDEDTEDDNGDSNAARVARRKTERDSKRSQGKKRRRTRRDEEDDEAAAVAHEVSYPAAAPVKSWEAVIGDLHRKLMVQETSQMLFNEPVDLDAFGDYMDVVDTPMDFLAILQKLTSSGYRTAAEYKADVELVFSNARAYNEDNDGVLEVTEELAKFFTQCFKQADWSQSKAPVNRTPVKGQVKVALEDLHGKLMQVPEAEPFNEPVDPEALGLLDYLDVIATPMDLGSIRDELQTDAYPCVEAYIADIHLTFDNCMEYNQPGSDIFLCALALKQQFDRDMLQLRSLRPEGGVEFPRRLVFSLHRRLMARREAKAFAQSGDGEAADDRATQRPLDLGGIQAKLDQDAYRHVEAYAADIRRVFATARASHRPGSRLYDSTIPLADFFEAELGALERRLAQRQAQRQAEANTSEDVDAEPASVAAPEPRGVKRGAATAQSPEATSRRLPSSRKRARTEPEEPEEEGGDSADAESDAGPARRSTRSRQQRQGREPEEEPDEREGARAEALSGRRSSRRGPRKSYNEYAD